MTDTTTANPVARYSGGDVQELCTPRLDGANLAMTFEDGRTENHDITAFTVKAALGSYGFESEHTSFTLTFVDESTGAALSAAAAGGVGAAVGSAAAGLSAGNSAVRHINVMNALAASGYNDFYEPLQAVAGEFKESWRLRPTMLIRYAMLWISVPFLVGGSALLILAGAIVALMLPGFMVSSVLTDQSVAKSVLSSAMAFAFLTSSIFWVPTRVAVTGFLGVLAQNHWATPPQQCAHLDATTGTAADDHRLRNLFFHNSPRWISVATPYAALAVGLLMLLKQYNNPTIDVTNDGPVLGTAIFFVFVGVQLAFGIKMLIDSRTLQCDEAAWMEANITAENCLVTRANVVPLLRHSAFAGLLLVGAAAVFSVA